MTMFCHVTLPDLVVMEVEVDTKANGQDCLTKACQRLGIIEMDYFGLQFTGSKGESLWLNLRNRISQQMDSVTPWKLKLRVKFFVEPHLILQEQTRHLFLTHVKEELVQGSLCMDSEQVVELCALLAQAEFGDYNQDTAKYFCTQINGQNSSPSTINSTIARHKELHGVTQASAEYQALQLVSTLENYGVEWHWARDAEGQKMAIGVGPEGLSVCKPNFTPVNRFIYPTIQMATQSGRNVYVTIINGSEEHLVLLFKFISNSAASGLYRAITEIHAFYWCDTVTNTVMMQYSRDFKGHLASLFLNESVDMGKKYIFDVQRTSKEAYDRARRTLFNSSALSQSRLMSEEKVNVESTCEGCKETPALQDKLQRLQEALTCTLCCERELDTAFCPCGHIVCCKDCAAQLQCCPVCRSEIGRLQHVYLPTCASLLGLSELRGNASSEHRELDPNSNMPDGYRSDQAFLNSAKADI